jgi:hypothetical protein
MVAVVSRSWKSWRSREEQPNAASARVTGTGALTRTSARSSLNTAAVSRTDERQVAASPSHDMADQLFESGDPMKP